MPTQQDDQLPDGSWVEWQGRTYRGSIVMDPPRSVRIFSPTPDDPGFTPTRTGGWSRVLPEEQVTLFELRTHCRWRGEPFSVGRQNPDGTLLLGWLRNDAGRAAELGLTMADRYCWGTTVPGSEVTDLQQVRLEQTPDVRRPEVASEDALETVRTWLGGRSTPAETETHWQVRPYRDAWWVAPEPRTRGDSAYLVRRGTVRPIPSNGRTTTARSYREMVSEQDRRMVGRTATTAVETLQDALASMHPGRSCGPARRSRGRESQVAIRVVFQKVHETSQAVEYRYGPTEDQLPTTVVIDPRRPTEWPTVGGEDPLMPTVVRGVLKRRRATGAWPDHGVIEH